MCASGAWCRVGSSRRSSTPVRSSIRGPKRRSTRWARVTKASSWCSDIELKLLGLRESEAGGHYGIASTLRVHENVRVVVTGVHHYGIDVDFRGLYGFVQNVNVDWDPRVEPKDVARVGDEIDIRVLAVAGHRFSASIKHAHPELDPWADPTKFAVGTRHRGVVTTVCEYGSFVEIARLVEGLIQKKHFPGPYVSGQLVEVEVVPGPNDRAIALKPLSP